MSKHQFEAVIFDLDGVITKTANVHSRAWKKMFDDYLRTRAEIEGGKFEEFTSGDYLQYVDGKPRYDGVKSFLKIRNIDLPFGTPDDDPELETVCGLGNRKNEAFNDVLKNEGVEAYPSTVRLLEQLKKDGIRIGVASSSKNAEGVLTAAGLMSFIETRVDGVVSADMGLNGKPAPDIFLTAAKNLGVDPNKSIVVEDATSGVQAGKNGNFGLVLGLAREDNIQALLAHGADIVVEDLEEITLAEIDDWFVQGIADDNWRISYRNYDSEREKSREALLTVGNGFFGTRGAMEETVASDTNYPGTYIAGMYNRLKTPVAGRDIENEDFVNVPNWLPVKFKIDDGNWFDPNEGTIKEINRVLNLKNGLLSKTMLITDEKGRNTAVSSCRMVSMANPNLAAIKYTLTPLDYSGTISFCSSLDGTHINAGVKRYGSLNQQHLKAVDQGGDGNTTFLRVKTTQSDIEIVEAAKHTFSIDNKLVSTAFEISSEPGKVSASIHHHITKGQSVEIEKIVGIRTSLFGNDNIKGLAESDVEHAASFSVLLEQSELIWDKIWSEIDIRLEGDRLSQKLLRLHNYHLIVSASPFNAKLDASVTARGLHGEAYRGHIFWDELFILPFYNIHFPEVAKSLLMYRYRRLDKAREYAQEYGYQGAMFPWQSGSDGREETQVLHLNPISGEWGDDHSSLQRHVSLAIAFNVWQYFHMTGDVKFIEHFGAEMFFEICRFWASKTQFDEKTGKYSIKNVMGPDEFHEMYPDTDEGGITDNAYTNIMISWMFARVPDLLARMDKASVNEVCEKINLDETEINKWDVIHKKLKLVISDEGIISQYDGYFDLKELDWDQYRTKYGNIYRMDRLLKAEGKSADDYKVAKQADTLMTFYNLDKTQVDEILVDLGYELPPDYLRNNLEYYLARTSHGSTLSRVVHAQLAEMIGDKKLSWDLYSDALSSDFNDIQGGTTAEGIHAGVMAGTIMIAVSTFAGVDLRGELMNINPGLPKPWNSLCFNLQFKGVRFQMDITRAMLKVKADQTTEILVKGEKHMLPENKIVNIKL